VEHLELFPGRVPAAVPFEPVGDRAVAKRRADVPDALGVLGMELGHLHERRGRVLEDAGTGVVQERVLVPVGAHAHVAGVTGASERMMWRRSVLAAAAVETGVATWIEIT
jgi:hypothetical protein